MDLVMHPEGCFEVFGQKYRPEWGRPPIGEDGSLDRGMACQMIDAGMGKLQECLQMDYNVPPRVSVTRSPNGEITAFPHWVSYIITFEIITDHTQS